jgi:hypothetical protein
MVCPFVGQDVTFTDRERPASRSQGVAQRFIDAMGAWSLSSKDIGQVSNRDTASHRYFWQRPTAKIEGCFAAMNV